MALDSNVVNSKDVLPLPHFYPFPSANSRDVNLKLLSQNILLGNDRCRILPAIWPHWSSFEISLWFKIPLIIPECRPSRFWWTVLNARCCDNILLGQAGRFKCSLQPPSRAGFKPIPCPTLMWAFRVSLSLLELETLIWLFCCSFCRHCQWFLTSCSLLQLLAHHAVTPMMKA